MEVQVHECRWSAAQRQVQMERWAPAAAPNHTAFTSFIADLAAAEAPSRISDLHRPSLDFWPFVDVGRREEGRGGEGMRRVGKGGPRSKKAGGEVSEAKGTAAVTSESGPVLAARKKRGGLLSGGAAKEADGRTAARAGARPLGDGLGESLAADTWTDGPERGFGGIKRVVGGWGGHNERIRYAKVTI